MPINYDKLMNMPVLETEHSYGVRDTILYALGLGYGNDPLDGEELRFVYEKDIRVHPVMAVILGYPGTWLQNPETGIDWLRVVHGEQGVTLHKPLPAAGTVIGRSRITGIVDKGPQKGALLYTERDVVEKASGQLLATLTSTAFLRGDGGFGGPSGPVPEPHPMPGGAPNVSIDLPTLPQAALIYRLSGDLNPLHAGPGFAAAAGFPRPILHGLCTFGVAGRAILKLCCGNDQSRLKKIQARFSAPVFPGETIRTEIWQDGTQISFRARTVERDSVVLNNGLAIVEG